MWRLSRIFYTAAFAILSFILLFLTLVTPGDIINQSYENDRLGNIFATAGVYIITGLLAVLIYASRIFTNRTVLASIPRQWIPVEKLDVPKSVRRLVVEGLTTSAVVAQQARPRDRTDEDDSTLDPRLTIPAEVSQPWGNISHPGWTAPECPDLPDQGFDAVIRELPHILEAKAVSLAPPDPHYGHGSSNAASHDPTDNIPDERVVDILQRPRSMCLRGYLNHLARLDMIHNADTASSFVRLFERARYSNKPLTELEFRSTMSMFAELLRGMTGLDPELVAEIQAEYSFGGTDSMSTRTGPSSGDNDNVSFTSDAASFTSSQSGTMRRGRSQYHPLSTSASDRSSSRSFRIRDIGDQQNVRSYSPRRNDWNQPPRSLRQVPSNLSGSSGHSVVRRPVGDDGGS